MKTLSLSLSLLLLTSTSALADNAALLRCRAIQDGPARLACYDAMPLAPVGAKAAAPSPQAPAAQFGLEQQALKSAPDAIESHITGRFDGWGPNARIVLANGQIWQVTDDSRGVYSAENPKVRVRRGALGAFYLEIEGINRSPRVKRLQ
jgi:hypothetical protein